MQLSVDIKEIKEGKATTVAHMAMTEVEGNPDPEYADFKYIVQEPGGAILEGTIENFHRHRGALTLVGLVVSASGHYGQVVQMPANEIAKLLGHEKMEEIAGKLKDQGD